MTQPLRFGVFLDAEATPRALFHNWNHARRWADDCARDDHYGRYVVKQKVEIPPPGLGSMWTRCDTEEDIQ